MSFLKIHMKKKGNKHGWCCHHSTCMALKVKALHQYSITSLEIRRYIQFDAQETFVLATCQAGEDSRIFLGGSGGTSHVSFHLIEIWPNKKKSATAISGTWTFQSGSNPPPSLKRPTKNGSKEALRKTHVPLRPIPKFTPWHGDNLNLDIQIPQGWCLKGHIWGVQMNLTSAGGWHSPWPLHPNHHLYGPWAPPYTPWGPWVSLSWFAPASCLWALPWQKNDRSRIFLMGIFIFGRLKKQQMALQKSGTCQLSRLHYGKMTKTQQFHTPTEQSQLLTNSYSSPSKRTLKISAVWLESTSP